MNKRDLKKLTKKQLTKLLLKQQAQKPRNSVKHEDIIQPPEQFRDAYKQIPKPRLTDHLKCKMHEDHQNQLGNHHQSLKLKSI